MIRFKKLIRQIKDALRPVLKVVEYPNVAKTATIGTRNIIVNPNNLYMYGNSSLKRDSVIMNGRAKFILKKWSGAAEELMVITGNHMSIVGLDVKNVTDEVKDIQDVHGEYDRDVIVDEDVWMGARVSLLSGVHIGRGAEIGTGAVVRGSIPPYAVVVGNPAKVVGFRFTPEEIIQHEKILYPESERLPLELLEKNYKKYFLDHIKEIKAYTGLICK